ncbi:MAG TPA: PIN domain-containing protein [Candidatus Saccharimonadales bacterium]|nr:PIN domain-containing protein [Candidatus Saccharimonadales bacterium]
MLKVFVDSDVVIPSLISSNGAAFLLLNEIDELDLFISNISNQELEEVVDRLQLNREQLEKLISKSLTSTHLKNSIGELKEEYSKYVLDIDDAHIVAGAKEANVQFLISYNTKHFKADKLKEDFNIILTTPANLLQHLRSQ